MVVGDADFLHPQRDGPVYLCPDRRLAVPGKLSVHVEKSQIIVDSPWKNSSNIYVG